MIAGVRFITGSRRLPCCRWIDIELVQNRLTETNEYFRELLSPSQQLLPDSLTIAIEAAVRAWDAGQLDKAGTYIQQMILASRETGYL